ncbi:hypothetical protein [Marilutibacter chinensis]|uniref:Uncharacterized protein n=1 Tax=Marilutibacter chinensis TaxID=2912247 RepID=A0ABS9HS70_9GAMM|nr:hypothetical protein [Lysobacter chinensis]MCF7221770.1 hypothetical protein [Lysobacter chinensis]MCF7223706.1 hypothetical protein [Lysobacter chinensis]
MPATSRPSPSLFALSFIACTACALFPAQATPPAAAQCSRIADVDLDYEVAHDGARLLFTRRGERIEVAAGAVANADGRWTTATAAGYHADLQRFLDTSTAVAEQARPLTKLLRGPTPELARAALDVCGAVLALAESTQAIEAAAPGFRSPVRIRLDE